MNQRVPDTSQRVPNIEDLLSRGRSQPTRWERFSEWCLMMVALVLLILSAVVLIWVAVLT